MMHLGGCGHLWLSFLAGRQSLKPCSGVSPGRGRVGGGVGRSH